VIFGSLTAVVIFLLAQELFGVEIGLLSAFLWSISIIAIMVNRVAKEDTLLAFFTWLAYYFYLRAKRVSATDAQTGGSFYCAAGASFGLMLASKYFPHYMGLNALYHHWRGRTTSSTPLGKRDYVLFLGSCAVVFVLFNPVVLLPSTLDYMFHYMRGASITHHGYLMMGRLYSDEMSRLSGGMPVYFYALFLAIKTPLPILGALIVGLVTTWKRRREPGPSFVLFMFLWWIVPFSIVGGKFLRYMLAWMPAVCIIAAIGLVGIFSRLVEMARRRIDGPLAPALVATVALALAVNPVWAAVKSSYYSLYLNALGFHRTAYYFPHDEMNDMGLREAIRRISEEAPYGARVGGEAGPIFKYYFHKLGRDDLRYFNLSDQAKKEDASPSAFLVVQEGRKYFENISFIERVESYQAPIHTVEIGGAAAARIYRGEQLAELRAGR